MCSNWACTESVRGEVSDGLPYLDRIQTVIRVFLMENIKLFLKNTQDHKANDIKGAAVNLIFLRKSVLYTPEAGV